MLLPHLLRLSTTFLLIFSYHLFHPDLVTSTIQLPAYPTFEMWLYDLFVDDPLTVTLSLVIPIVCLSHTTTAYAIRLFQSICNICISITVATWVVLVYAFPGLLSDTNLRAYGERIFGIRVCNALSAFFHACCEQARKPPQMDTRIVTYCRILLLAVFLIHAAMWLMGVSLWSAHSSVSWLWHKFSHDLTYSGQNGFVRIHI